MKSWSDDHPKAKLMARKRSAIVAAAQDTFLRVGYDGASMDGIAQAAGVSIMTLYRHAESKEDLFLGVLLSACDVEAEHGPEEYETVLRQPLDEALTRVGTLFQDKLTRPEATALLRIVIVEAKRFPQLAEAAYQQFVGSWRDNLDGLLARHDRFKAVVDAKRKALIAGFLDDMVGTDLLRGLLGLAVPEPALWQRRAGEAAARLIAQL